MRNVDPKSADCAVQHIKVFRQQAINNELADFGKPCEECPYNSECDFNFFEQLKPILNNTDKVKLKAIIYSR